MHIAPKISEAKAREFFDTYGADPVRLTDLIRAVVHATWKDVVEECAQAAVEWGDECHEPGTHRLVARIRAVGPRRKDIGDIKVPIPRATDEQAHAARAMACWGTDDVRCTLAPIRVEGLLATQDTVSLARVDELCADPASSGASTHIVVAEIGKKKVIVEGHHRATAAIRRGEKTVRAVIVTRVPRKQNAAASPEQSEEKP